MKKIIQIIIFLGVFISYSQMIKKTIDIETPILDEISGLIYYNNSLITHNDSGNEASLYEIDTETGALVRTVIVTGATNVDWEDIAQDDAYIYIGDIGNNFGNRTDLTIYKISKEDYNDGDNVVLPEVITYSYENQSEFNANLNANNWDAEGLVSYGDNLLIFTKNWEDNRVNVYAISKTNGNHIATLESTYNVNGLITGVDISMDENTLYLVGYNNFEAPFLYTIHAIPNNSLDVFAGVVSEKITNITPIGNQVEAISFIEKNSNKHSLYVSNEKFTFTIGATEEVFPAKLRLIEIDIDTSSTLTIKNNEADSLITIYPNPFKNEIKLNKKVDEIIIFDSFGRSVMKEKFIDKLLLSSFTSGVYVVSIKINNSKIIKKIIKE